MKKIPLIVISLFAKILFSFAQGTIQDDSAQYANRKLTVEEINFVSGYYQQDGNHSAVTGGTGTEKLTDFANTLDLKLSRLNAHGNKSSLALELGIDTYTSASSDNISPLTSASRQDMRIYPSVTFMTENKNKALSLGGGLSYSHEYDYVSRGLHFNFVKSTQDQNSELAVNLFAYFDSWTVIYPDELRPPRYGSGSEHESLDVLPRDSYQASFTFSQVIDEKLQCALLFDPAYQQGQLTTLYQRVYFNDNSEAVEKLPDERLKIPVAVRANYFLSDRFIIRGYYRFYFDDWGNTANTAGIEVPIKINPFFSVTPFYRFSTQSGIDYFAGYKEHMPGESFYTSDYDLAPFNSHFMGLGIRLAPPSGIFGAKHWNSIEVRYGHYLRTPDLRANSISMALKFK